MKILALLIKFKENNRYILSCLCNVCPKMGHYNVNTTELSMWKEKWKDKNVRFAVKIIDHSFICLSPENGCTVVCIEQQNLVTSEWLHMTSIMLNFHTKVCSHKKQYSYNWIKLNMYLLKTRGITFS